MNAELYEKLKRGWKPPVYQTWPRTTLPSRWGDLPVLKDRVVLDVGCNAAMTGIELNGLARGYIGIEPSKHFYEQALFTKRFIKMPCSIFHATLGQFVERHPTSEYDALYASRVLYHLHPPEVKIFLQVVLPKCKVVLATSREDKHGSIQNSRRLFTWQGLKRIFEKAGLEVEVGDTTVNDVPVIGRRP